MIGIPSRSERTIPSMPGTSFILNCCIMLIYNVQQNNKESLSVHSSVKTKRRGKISQIILFNPNLDGLMILVKILPLAAFRSKDVEKTLRSK